MKSLAITVILLLCVLLLSCWNYFYVNNTLSEMGEKMNALPDVNDIDCIAYTKEIDDYWRSKEAILEMSIPYPLIDRVCEQASLLCACADAKDAYGFYSARALMLDALEDISRSECINIRTLL